MAPLRTNDSSDLSSDEFPRLRKLEKVLQYLENYERDYLTPDEFGIWVGTLLFYGGILAGFYKMYMFLSAEEDRILREIRRRRNNNSSGNGNNGNNNSNNGNNNCSGDKED